jgi:hypothetical protein
LFLLSIAAGRQETIARPFALVGSRCFFTDIFSIGEQAACGRLPLARWILWVDKMEKKAVFLH